MTTLTSPQLGMNQTETKQSHSQTNWRWQFDPLSESDRVQITNEDGVILAEVASIKSANYVTHRLNNHEILVAALESMTEIVEQCAPMYEHALSKSRAALQQSKGEQL